MTDGEKGTAAAPATASDIPTVTVRAPNAKEQQLKREVLKQCELDRALLLVSQPFTAKLLLQLELVAVVDDRLPTAGTDGERIFFNAGFMAGRAAQDRRFILAHEVWHCALGHHRRVLGRKADIWNQACDYEVNGLLREEFGYCPPDALEHEHFRGHSAEQIYDTLIRRSETNPLSSGQVLDEHDLAEASMRDASVMDPDFNPAPVTSEAARQWRERLVSAAQQMARDRGDLPGNIARLIERLQHPSVPWQQELASFMETTYEGDRRWLPPSRRHLHAGLYLPSRRGRQMDLAVAVDTSGSCQPDLPEFLTELHGILGAADRVRLRILDFDTRVTQEREIDETRLHQLRSMQFRGGRGSDCRAVFTRLENEPPQALVVLTDGLIRAPAKAPGYPVVWCLTADGQAPVDWGRCIQLRPRPRD